MQLTRCAQIVPTTQSGISAINITIQQNQGGEHLKQNSFWHKTSLLERYLTETWKKYHSGKYASNTYCSCCFIWSSWWSRIEYVAYDNTYLIRCLHYMSRCPFRTLIFTAKHHNSTLNSPTVLRIIYYLLVLKILIVFLLWNLNWSLSIFICSSKPYGSLPISCRTTFHNKSNNFSKRSSILLITELHCLEPDTDVSCWEWDI